MKHEQITVSATDGPCNAHVLTPDGEGSWPGVIFYTDAFGIRPAMIEMATHLASGGYVVIVPDLFYRFGPYGPLVPKEVLAGDFRAIVGPLMASTDNLRAAEDTAGFLAALDARADVAGDKVGATGYCMGGGMAISAAGAYPDRVAAAASFHGGNLATDEPTSPHLFAPKIKAEVYVAGADHDQQLSSGHGGTPGKGFDRSRRAPSLRDLRRQAARLDEARHARLRRRRRRARLARTVRPLRAQSSVNGA